MKKILVFICASVILSACGDISGGFVSSIDKEKNTVHFSSDDEFRKVFEQELKRDCLNTIQKEHLVNGMTAEWFCDCSNIYLMDGMDISMVRKIFEEPEKVSEQDKNDLVERGRTLRLISASLCMGDFHDGEQPGWKR